MRGTVLSKVTKERLALSLFLVGFLLVLEVQGHGMGLY